MPGGLGEHCGGHEGAGGHGGVGGHHGNPTPVGHPKPVWQRLGRRQRLGTLLLRCDSYRKSINRVIGLLYVNCCLHYFVAHQRNVYRRSIKKK